MSASNLSFNPHLSDLPAYVPGKSKDMVKPASGFQDIIKLGSNENPLGPSPSVVEVIRDLATETHYYPGAESDDLRSRLAERLGADFTADNVVVGNGSAEILKAIAQVVFFAGGDAVISRPAFQMYEIATRLFGGQPVFVPHRNYHYDLDAIASAITDRTRLVFVTNPNNPTGLFLGQRQVDELMVRIPPHVTVVFDEAYCEYVDSPEYPDTLRYVREGCNVIITRTFSKVYGLAGMRVGYGITTQTIAGYLLNTQSAFHVNRLSLRAALAALGDEEHKLRTLRNNADGKAYLYRKFDELGLRYLPTQANYILLIDLPHDIEVINQGLLQRGVILRPTAPFGIPQALRVTIGTPEQNRRVVETLAQVIDELNRSTPQTEASHV